MDILMKPFKEMVDPRVRDWPFLTSTTSITSIITFYLMMIYWIIPKYMEKREAYTLKRVIFFYNILQIGICTTAIYYGTSALGGTTDYIFNCRPEDYNVNRPISMKKLRFIYGTMFVKCLELIETVFFALRKKSNQISGLHVYHHASTLVLNWVACHYGGGEALTFPIIVNYFVHLIMYIYYLLSSLQLSRSLRMKLNNFKPKLTMLQMIQFCIIIAHFIQDMKSECPVPMILLSISTIDTMIIFYLFWKFYRDSYLKNKLI